jgi:excisionase family DNA binding protein
MFTLGTAAKHVGKSKPTISKAIKDGKLSATKVNGVYQIDPSELHRVYPPTVQSERSETPVNTGLSSEIIILQVKLEAAERRISDLETDRDAWRSQSQRLLTSNHTIKTGFFSRIFGK